MQFNGSPSDNSKFVAYIWRKWLQLLPEACN